MHMQTRLFSSLRGKKIKSGHFWIVSLLTGALIFSPMCALTARANDEFPQYGDFSFDEENGCIMEYLGEAKELVIPDDLNGTPVVAIGDGAFSSSGLTAVSFPDSLQEIGESAFSYNPLNRLEFPDSLRVIGSWSFNSCDIRELSLPEGLERIESGAFSNNELTALEIPASVQKLGYDSFSDNLLKTVTFDGAEDASSALTWIDDSAFKDNAITDLILPASLQKIAYAAFKDNQLQTLELKSEYPYSLLDIDNKAFEGNRLTSLTLPPSVRSIQDDAFRDNQLTEVILPRFLSDLGSGAFKDNKLRNVELPGLIAERKDESKEDILGDVFDVTVEASREELSLEEFLSLSEEQIKAGSHHTGEKVQRLEPNPERDFAFDKDSGTISKFIGEGVEVMIPKTIDGVQVRVIGDGVFSNKSLVAVSLPEGLEEIGSDAFSYNSLTSIKLPESLVKIGDWAFSSNGLARLELPEALKSIGQGSFYANSILSLEIPASVESIGDQAFSGNCLRSLVFLGEDALTGAEASQSSLMEEATEATDKAPETEGPLGLVSVLGSSDKEKDTEGTESLDMTQPPMPSGQASALTSIGGYAFCDNELLALRIPASVQKIGNGAFENNLLGSLEFETDYPYTFLSISWSAFEDNRLSRLSLPDSVQLIDDDAFRNNCLTEVHFPRLIAYLGDGAFMENKLTEIELPGIIAERKHESKEDILGDVFDTTVVATIKPLSADEILLLSIEQEVAGTHHYGRQIQRSEPNPERDFAFDKDSGTISKFIGEGVEVMIPETIDGVQVRVIGDGVFSNKSLVAVSLPEGLEEIGSDAFSYNSLTSIKLPESLVKIGDWAFSSNGLAMLELPEALTTIGEGSFYANRLLSLNIPATVESIGYEAFDSNHLRSVVFADDSHLTSIGAYAFSTNELLLVELPSGLQDIGDHAFEKNLIQTAPPLPDSLIKEGTDIFFDNLIDEK